MNILNSQKQKVTGQFSIPCAYFVYTVWHCTGQ